MSVKCEIGDIVIIDWVDHTSRDEWQQLKDEIDLRTVRTVGFLVHEDDKKFVVVSTLEAGEISDDMLCGHKSAIAKVAVQSIEILGRGNE